MPPLVAVVVVAVHLVLVGAIVVGELSAEVPPSSAAIVLDVSVGVAGSLALPWLAARRAVGATVLVALAALSPVATPLAASATLWVARRRTLGVAVDVAVASVGTHLVRGQWRPVSGLSPGWWLALVMASFAALVGWGAWVQARQALLASPGGTGPPGRGRASR